MSRSLISRIYDVLCGEHPNQRFWHFQWLSAYNLHKEFRPVLHSLEGAILDVGCGEQPYRGWFDESKVKVYTGIDIFPGPKVDLVIEPGKPWSIESASYDVVICNQVLEHVRELEVTLVELHRVLKPGGTLLITVPFDYNEHGIPPNDYRRLTQHGVRMLFENDYDIERLITQGAVGSNLGIHFLNWFILGSATRVLVAVLFPLWILLCLIVNTIGFLMDKVDATGQFYFNVMMVAKKKANVL